MEVEVKKVNIPFDMDTYQRIEEAAKAEHLQIATFCRQKLLMFLEGKLVEANGHKTEKCLETCDS